VAALNGLRSGGNGSHVGVFGYKRCMSTMDDGPDGTSDELGTADGVGEEDEPGVEQEGDDVKPRPERL
jgi:hypothetical protein